MACLRAPVLNNSVVTITLGSSPLGSPRPSYPKTTIEGTVIRTEPRWNHVNHAEVAEIAMARTESTIDIVVVVISSACPANAFRFKQAPGYAFIRLRGKWQTCNCRERRVGTESYSCRSQRAGFAGAGLGIGCPVSWDRRQQAAKCQTYLTVLLRMVFSTGDHFGAPTYIAPAWVR
jgi:hypothetical protein